MQRPGDRDPARDPAKDRAWWDRAGTAQGTVQGRSLLQESSQGGAGSPGLPDLRAGCGQGASKVRVELRQGAGRVQAERRPCPACSWGAQRSSVPGFPQMGPGSPPGAPLPVGALPPPYSDPQQAEAGRSGAGRGCIPGAPT